MEDKLIYLIENEAEGLFLDFKSKNYIIGKAAGVDPAKKYDLIKDILSMANSAGSEDRYIIVGVKEKDGVADSFEDVTDLEDEASYQSLVNENIEPEINFEFKTCKYKEFKLAYFRIFDNSNRPYLIKKDIVVNGKNLLREGDGLIRRGSQTVKMSRAHFDYIYSNNLHPDRKSDIQIDTTIEEPLNRTFRGFKYLDVSISNISNKSISLDFQLVIRVNKDFRICPEYIFQRERAFNSDRAEHYMNASIRFPASPNLKYEEDSDYISFIINGVEIKQEQNLFDVFSQDTMIEIYDSAIIQGVLIIRSNDFTTGMLEHKFELPISKS